MFEKTIVSSLSPGLDVWEMDFPDAIRGISSVGSSCKLLGSCGLMKCFY